jgi:hypothetical protein
MGWLSLKAGHLITRLCARMLQSTKEDNVMSRLKIDPLIDELAHKETSAGIKFKDIPDDARHEVEWIEGCHVFNRHLPSLDELPVPRILYQLSALHPDRPRGSRAMLCAHGAKGRLVGLRPGAWTVTPFNDWRYAIFPNGQVGWIPKEMDLPQTLFVPFRNDVH